MNGKVYILVTMSQKTSGCIDLKTQYSRLYLWQKGTKRFDIVQQLPLTNVADAVHFSSASNNENFLALSKLEEFSDQTDKELFDTRNIYIYRNRHQSGCHFTLFQKLVFTNPTQLSAFSFGSSYLQQYLVALNETTVAVWQRQGI